MSRIVVCGVQTLYVQGGAEILVQSLAQGLRARGHQVDEVNLPFTDAPRSHLVLGFLAWRLLHLKSAHGRLTDLLIATKFPSYAARHHNKAVWLVHQHRQAYDLFGSRYSDMHARPDGRLFAALVRGLDRWALGEARRLYTISANTAARLQRFNGLRGEPLYPPPKLAPYLHSGDYGDFVLAPGRFEPIKRFDLILQAAALAPPPLRFVLAGDGLERDRLEALAAQLGLGGRVTFAGRVDDKTLVGLYAGCLGVVYPPYDEDYGYVTVEALLARKPVVSTADAGGVLEFLEDGVNGFVGDATPEGLAQALGRLWEARGRAPALGAAGYERVRGIAWGGVLDRLTETLA
jgi:glycosyltransferase involved in cell wall biosynthesis